MNGSRSTSRLRPPSAATGPGPLAAILLVLAACGGEPPTTSARSIASISLSPGSGTVASLGATVSFSATARDASGDAVSGVTFSWTSSAPGVVEVSGAGVATAVANGSAQVRASAEGVTGSATLTVSQEPGALNLVDGNAQAARVRETLAAPLRVRVLDARSNPIQGVDVTWEVLTGGGSIDGSPTDATGTSSATWTLGPASGVGTARARAGVLSITFTAEALGSGGIEGVVTGQGAFLSPPMTARMVRAASGSVGDGRAPASSARTAERVRASGARPASGGGSRAPKLLAAQPDRFAAPSGPLAAPAGAAVAVPGELLVRLRAERVGMPGVAARARWSRAQAEDVRALMRQAASAWRAEEGLEVAGASPVLATVRVRVPPGREEAVRRRLLQRPEVESVERNGLMWATGRGPHAVPPVRPVRPAPAGFGAWPPAVDLHAVPPAPLPAVGSNRRPPGVTPTHLGAWPLWPPGWHPPLRRGTSQAPAAAGDEPIFPFQAWHYDVIDALGAWEVTTGSQNVIVAVVDDGIRFDHPDIADNLRTDGYDFVQDEDLSGCTSGTFSTSMDGDGPDPDPTVPALLDFDFDFNCVRGTESVGGHGLHVAGTVAARAGNAEGGVGLAWEVGIRPVRVLGSAGFGSFDDIAQGVLYAAGLPADAGANGMVQPASAAHVINMSLGGTSSSTTLQTAIEAATTAGSLVIAAAGNNASSSSFFPASYPEVLSVSSVAPDLSLAFYSNFGSTVDIAAPGGELSPSADYGVWSLVWDFQSDNPLYASFQGTSMAAPHVSGVAALVLAAEGGLDADELRARLVDHAADIGPTGPDEFFGAGLVQAGASVRGGPGSPPDTYVLAYDAQGALVGSVRAAGDGSYAIADLPDGAYRVYAGHDRGADGLTGLFERRWGALGGSTTPSSITIAASSVETASFGFGFPLESEPNDTRATADPLPLGGYVYGEVEPGGDVDVYRLDLAAQTDLLVETDALTGACGFADQLDTVLRLLDENGLEMVESDDIDDSVLKLCSRIETTVSAGTYYVEVTGPGIAVGSYAVRVAEAP